MSSTPTAGLVASPIKPLPTPLKNPRAPSVSAPSKGLRARPPTPDATLVMKLLAPAVTPYKACFGLLRALVIRRRSWNCLSSDAAASPLLRLPVNLEKLSLKPNTVFFANEAAPLAIPKPNSSGLSDKIRPWVTQEVGRSKNLVNLIHDFLTVVTREVLNEDGSGHPHVVQDERVELEWRFVDVSNSHGHDVEEEHDRVVRRCLVLGIDTFRPHKAEVELHGLNVEHLKRLWLVHTRAGAEVAENQRLLRPVGSDIDVDNLLVARGCDKLHRNLVTNLSQLDMSFLAVSRDDDLTELGGREVPCVGHDASWRKTIPDLPPTAAILDSFLINVGIGLPEHELNVTLVAHRVGPSLGLHTEVHKDSRVLHKDFHLDKVLTLSSLGNLDILRANICNVERRMQRLESTIAQGEIARGTRLSDKYLSLNLVVQDESRCKRHNLGELVLALTRFNRDADVDLLVLVGRV
ncbi:hypothetical protein HG531_013255 [Fusarium graminearum]|nr:hypothetical protein HG531_013255 [Fusarium graminearum]